MTFPLASLPNEVVTYHLLPLLGPDDLINFCIACSFGVTRGVYRHVFHEDSRFDEYGLSMFQQRARAQLYVFGSSADGRLGGLDASADSHFETVGKGRFRRMHRPFRIEAANPIVQVSAGTESLMLLTSKGELYFTGLVSPESHTKSQLLGACRLHKFETARLVPGEDLSINSEQAKERIRHEFDESALPLYESYYADPAKHRCFVDAQADFDMIILDSEGLVWSLGRSSIDGGRALFASELGRDGKLLASRAVRLRSHSCFYEGRGIAYFVYILEDRYMRRLPVQDAAARILPGTARGILDWADSLGWLLYLKADGHAVLVDVRKIFDYGDSQFDRCVDDLKEVNALGKFVQVSGHMGHFSLVHEDGRVVMVCPRAATSTTYIVKFEVVEGLRGLDIVSIAVGDTHCLALTKQGDVYSWGRERELNGCLGFGRLEDALKLDGVKIRRGKEDVRHTYLVQKTPTKIKLPGRAYGVYAGSDYSAVLVYDMCR